MEQKRKVIKKTSRPEWGESHAALRSEGAKILLPTALGGVTFTKHFSLLTGLGGVREPFI